MIWKSHLLSMIVYAIFVCIVLALLRREDKKSQIKYALFLFLIMVVGGLLTTENRAAALLVKPLLDSPYNSLTTTASLVLGRFAEPAAAKRLGAVIRHPQRHPPQIVTMACWYLLKIHKHTRPCVEQLVRVVKQRT